MECTRCGVELEDGEELSKNGQSFCEDCYDHMFVSWNEVLKNDN